MTTLSDCGRVTDARSGRWEGPIADGRATRGGGTTSALVDADRNAFVSELICYAMKSLGEVRWRQTIQTAEDEE